MPLIGRIRIGLEGEINVGRRIGAEGRAQHADHGVRLAVEHDDAADRIRIAAKPADPKTMTHDSESRAAGPILSGRENTTDRRFRAENREEIGRDVDAFYLLRHAAAADVEAGAG